MFFCQFWGQKALLICHPGGQGVGGGARRVRRPHQARGAGRAHEAAGTRLKNVCVQDAAS